MFYGVYRRPTRWLAYVGAYGVLLAVATYLVPEALPADVIPAIVGGVALASLYAYAGYVHRDARWFGVVKPLLLATTWSYLTSILVGLLTGSPWGLAFASRLTFFLALALCFDYRDAHADRRSGLTTLSARAGRLPTMIATVVLLVTSAALPYLGTDTYDALTAWALSLTSLIAVPLGLWAFRQNRPAHLYYELVLDGLLLLPLLLYLTRLPTG